MRGGTGWGAEFAKLCNKPLFVFDQEQERLVPVGRRARRRGPRRNGSDEPVIEHVHFTGTGTRMLMPDARDAITALFKRSF